MNEPTDTPTPRTDAHFAGRLAYYAEDKKFAVALERELAQTQAAADDCDSIVASCNCLTKTPDIQFHKIGCKYRLISERDTALRERDAKAAHIRLLQIDEEKLLSKRDAIKAELAAVRETCGSAVLAQHQAVERAEKVEAELAETVARLDRMTGDLVVLAETTTTAKAELAAVTEERDSTHKVRLEEEARADALRVELAAVKAKWPCEYEKQHEAVSLERDQARADERQQTIRAEHNEMAIANLQVYLEEMTTEKNYWLEKAVERDNRIVELERDIAAVKVERDKHDNVRCSYAAAMKTAQYERDQARAEVEALRVCFAEASHNAGPAFVAHKTLAAVCVENDLLAAERDRLRAALEEIEKGETGRCSRCHTKCLGITICDCHDAEWEEYPPEEIARAALNTLQPLTGQWRTRCTVCGKEYEQGCGSSDCCGALQEIIQEEPAPPPGVNIAETM